MGLPSQIQNLNLGHVLLSVSLWLTVATGPLLCQPLPQIRLPLSPVAAFLTAPLPAVVVVLRSVVHEDISSGPPGPQAGQVDHGADNEVVPEKMRRWQWRREGSCGGYAVLWGQ